MKRKRVTIPKKIVDEVLYSADLLCCVCENRGEQIHHLDENPSNNSIENLALLCFRHHDEVTKKGGLSRKLSRGVIERYRVDLHRKIEAKRSLPSLEKKLISSGEESPEERLHQLMMDAVFVCRLDGLIDLFEGDPVYAPNEAELTTAELGIIPHS